MVVMSAGNWKAKGDDAAATRDFKLAIDCYSKAIALDPTNHMHFSNRSTACLLNHDATQALADAEKCIHLNPSWVKGYGQKGAALCELGDFDNSINVFKQGLDVEPHNMHLKEGLANVQNRAQKYCCPSQEILVSAACSGDLAGINALLRMGCGVNEFFKICCKEFTPLGWALKSRQEEAVKLLLAAGADVNLEQRAGGGLYPLLAAPVMFGDPGMVELLISAGASVHAYYDKADQWTHLHFAAAHGHVEVARVLLAAGARIDARTKANRMLPIYFAVRNGHAAVVELLINAGASVHADVDETQRTMLHDAAGEGHVEVVRVLLAAGARVNARTTEQQMPLHFAARNGHVEVARVLLAAGARIDAPAPQTGMSPLAFAMDHGHIDVVELLIKAGASVHQHMNAAQYTILHGAAMEGRVEVARVLLAAGARVNARTTNKGYTPLMSCLDTKFAATAEGLTAARKMVKLLIKAGADVNARETGPGGLSVLHLACLFYCPEIVQDLLDAGADIDAKDNHGICPLTYAMCSRSGESKPAKQVADTKAVLQRWKKTHAAGGGGGGKKRQACTEERGVIAVGRSGGAGAGAGAGVPRSSSSLVLKKGHFSGEVQDKKKKKKKKKAPVRGESRVCDGPDCSSVGVHRCKACKRPAYCSVECQRAHWNGGHKQECKMWRED